MQGGSLPVDPDVQTDATGEQILPRLFSSVSHDLKTPLATIIGALEVYQMMNERLTAARKSELVSGALSEARRLDRHISNILDCAKLEAGSVRPSVGTHQLRGLIDDAIDQLANPKARVQIAVLPAEDFALSTDGVLLSRALSLIFDNALKHTGPHPNVTVEMGSTGDEAFVHVRDHGPGIPEDKLELIFSKYERLNRGDTKNAGTGLGLSITRLILNLLSGRISARNHSQTGAVFSLYLPTTA